MMIHRDEPRARFEVLLVTVFSWCGGSIVALTGCPSTPIIPGSNTNSTGNTNSNTSTNTNDNSTAPVERPALLGLEADKRALLPLSVQAAFNDDTMFFRLSFEGDRGDRHDYQHFTGGAWRTEGGHRREGQSTLDNDPRRGRTRVTSTIYESRATFMINDPEGPHAVAGFDRVGCTLTCHDSSRAMPLWVEEAGDVRKYLDDDHPGVLDLWHWRIHRANPTGYSDDQFVSTVPADGTMGSRNNDAGTHPFRTNSLDEAGNPAFVLDPDSAGGAFAFPFQDVYVTDAYYMMDPAAADLGPYAPNPVALAFADALAMGYVPADGDAVPGRILQQPTESAADITADGTRFLPSADDPGRGTWIADLQRLLDTGFDDDVALSEGRVFDVAFAVHVGKVTVRDHHVSMPYTLSLEGGDADLQAVRITGSGREAGPDFDDATQFPVTTLNLYLPGITSWEFVTNADAAEVFFDPRTSAPVDQNHAGASALLNQNLGCRDCHTVTASETFDPPRPGGFFSGALETLSQQRGGVFDPTPIPQE